MVGGGEVDVAGAGADDLKVVSDDCGGGGVVASGDRGVTGVFSEKDRTFVGGEFIAGTDSPEIGGEKIRSRDEAHIPRLQVGGEGGVVGEEGGQPEAGTAAEAVAQGVEKHEVAGGA